MIRAKNLLIVAVLAILGVWTVVINSLPDGTEKIIALEERVVKLERDYRLAAQARDHFRQKLDVVEKERSALTKNVQTFEQQVDSLRHEVLVRTQERDQWQREYESFRGTIRDLLSTAEARLPNARPRMAAR